LFTEFIHVPYGERINRFRESAWETRDKSITIVTRSLREQQGRRVGQARG